MSVSKSRKLRASFRTRVGKVSVYRHRSSWWVYYRENGKPVRRRIGVDRDAAMRVAAELNAQLACAAPTMLAFTPISIPALVEAFLEFHQQVLRSTESTVSRYRTALAHLTAFAQLHGRSVQAHQVDAAAFAAHLRTIEVAPNGHVRARRRPLRDKGVQFILEVCRSLMNFAAKRRHLPPYAANPFSQLPLDRFRIEDAKPIVLLDAEAEADFFRAADAWEFAIHFILAKTGVRVGEATHLLIDDVDFAAGWIHVRSKPGLGWRVKTGSNRRVPLVAEAVDVLRKVVADRRCGPVFLQRRYATAPPPLVGDQRALEREFADRIQRSVNPVGRSSAARHSRSLWREAGAVSATAVRNSYMRVAKVIGRPEATCPKSWRHGYATLLGEGRVDPQIRRLVMGHALSGSTELGMTARYSHPSGQTIQSQIDQALRLRPVSLAIAEEFVKGVDR